MSFSPLSSNKSKLNSPIKFQAKSTQNPVSDVWWNYDSCAIFFVLFPFLISEFRQEEQIPHWTILISNLFTVVEVGLTVKILVTWPAQWTDKMLPGVQNTATGKFNGGTDYVNAFSPNKSTGIGEIGGIPTETLTASQRARNFGISCELCGILGSICILYWVKHQFIFSNDVLSQAGNIDLAMFSLWECFKFAARVTAIFSTESSKTNDTKVQHSNFSSPVKLGALVPAEPRLSAYKLPKSRNSNFSAKGAKFDNIDMFKEVTVMITPFPLSHQPRPAKRPVENVRKPTKAILPIIKESDTEMSPVLPQLQPPPPIQSPLTLKLHDYDSLQRKTEDFLRQNFSMRKTVTPREMSLSQSWQNVNEYMQNPTTARRFQFFENLHRNKEIHQNRAFVIVCRIMDSIKKFDIHTGYTGAIYRVAVGPITSLSRFVYAVGILIPVNCLKLTLTVALFLPRIWVRIFILSPIFLVVKYFNIGLGNFQSFPERNGIPVSNEKLFQVICRNILEMAQKRKH